MKVLKRIERIVFIVAVAVAVAAFALSFVIDKNPAESMAVGMNTPFVIGFGFAVIFLLVGAMLRYNKNETLARIADAFLITIFVSIFSCCIFLILNNSTATTPLLGLVSAILYAVSSLLRFIIYLYGVIKPVQGEDFDPDNDKKIQLIIKWKGLLDKGVITKEEFEAKRVEILNLDKPVVEEKK